MFTHTFVFKPQFNYRKYIYVYCHFKQKVYHTSISVSLSLSLLHSSLRCQLIMGSISVVYLHGAENVIRSFWKSLSTFSVKTLALLFYIRPCQFCIYALSLSLSLFSFCSNLSVCALSCALVCACITLPRAAYHICLCVWVFHFYRLRLLFTACGGTCCA